MGMQLKLNEKYLYWFLFLKLYKEKFKLEKCCCWQDSYSDKIVALLKYKSVNIHWDLQFFYIF